jgi:hypothetical protein
MPRIAGGCLCGSVRYRSQAEPVMQVICHCKTCQKNSGSAFSMNVAVPQDTLELEVMNRGATRTGVDQADSRSTGNTVRSAAHTSTATARLTERWRSSRQGHLMTRHGSRQPCISGAPKSSRGFKFQKGPPRFPAIRPEQRRRKKKTAPKERLEKLPQRASKASVPRANEKGRHACAVLGVRVSALAWPTPARDSPLCLGAL